MKNFFRFYHMGLSCPRLLLGDICLAMELWEKLQNFIPGGVPH